MKIMKKVIAAVIMLGLGVVSLQAQRPEGRQLDPEKMAEKQTTHMTEKLALDEKQAAAVKEINLKYAQQQKAKQEKVKAEREAMRAERKQVQDARNAEYKKVLTPEQFEQMEKMHAERGEMRKGKRGRGAHRDRGGEHRNMSPEERAAAKTKRMTEHLGLDEKQTKELEQLNLDFSKKMELKKEEQKADREAMKKLQEEHKSNVEKILTPEQLEKFKAAEKNRGEGHRGKRKMDDGRM